MRNLPELPVNVDQISPFFGDLTQRCVRTPMYNSRHNIDTTNIVNRMYNKRSRNFTSDCQYTLMVRRKLNEIEQILSTRNSHSTGL